MNNFYYDGVSERSEHREATEQLIDEWEVLALPGQFGRWRDELFAGFDEQYGLGNWYFAWIMPSGEVWDFDQVFWNIYVGGYVEYFSVHPDEAEYLAANFSYAYDLTPITSEQAYDPYALIGVPGLPNQFHHVALNIAILDVTDGWRGGKPIAVRGLETEGEHWNPGHIPAREQHLSFAFPLEGAWWEPDSIEAVYQHNKVLCVRQSTPMSEQPKG